MVYTAITFTALTTYLLISLLLQLAAALYVQDGYGFSGNVNSTSPLGARIVMTGFSKWTSVGSLSLGNQAFVGGVFDGSYIWLVPHCSSVLVRVDKVTGKMTGFNAWPSGALSLGLYAFAGGIFDGTYVWLVPRNSQVVVRVDSSRSWTVQARRSSSAARLCRSQSRLAARRRQWGGAGSGDCGRF